MRCDDLLYRFLKELFKDGSDASQRVQETMLVSMGVWLPQDIYRAWPVLCPWVVRDPGCRTGPAGDQWSSPNAAGYMRDDNSMIKSLPRSLAIVAPGRQSLNGARMGTDFVAAHVWRECTDGGELASRRPLLNSFVPNLVWLPRQIAKLTDLEGGSVQRILQRLSWYVYRDMPVESRRTPVVEAAWAMLPPPSLSKPAGIRTHAFNHFVGTDGWFRTRRKRVDVIIGALRDIELGQPIHSKVITSRYTAGLPGLTPRARRELADFLSQF